MWSPINVGTITGCTDERDESNALQNTQREAIAYRLRIKELNAQIKEEREKAAEKIRQLEAKANAADSASAATDRHRRSTDSGSVGSDEATALRKKVDQLMLIKAASEFRILELEGKVKKYKSRLTSLLREKGDGMSVLTFASSGKDGHGGMAGAPSSSGYTPKKLEQRDHELAHKIGVRTVRVHSRQLGLTPSPHPLTALCFPPPLPPSPPPPPRSLGAGG